MANGSTDTSTKSTPASSGGDPDWVADLSPADQVAYRKARLAWRQASAAYEAAERTAKVGKEKPGKDFEAGRDAYDARVTERDELKKDAGKKKALVNQALEAVKPEESDDATAAATQIGALQAAVDAYKAAVQGVAKKGDEITAAQAALAKLANPQDNFDRKNISVNDDAVLLAEDQYRLDVATAEIARNAAEDVFQEAAATLQSHLE